MAIPISYSIRNLKLRKGLTFMTALGIALTVTTAGRNYASNKISRKPTR